MKLNFKKISAIAGSVLMTGLTIGTAAAASFPAPFVQSGTANVALVYGASSTDMPAVTSIKTKLDSVMPAGSVTVDGDNFVFEKSTSKFWLGNKLLEVVPTSLDNDELSSILAKGTYIDADNEEFEYKQKIDMANLTLNLFDDNDYARDTPTIGFNIADGANILNYTLDFSTNPLWSDLPDTELVLLGKKYYVLSTSGNDTLNLLDSANTVLLSEGESKTIDGKSISIAFIGTNQVKLTVDGITTNTLNQGSTQKLSDGSYVGIKDILTQDYQGGVKQVEFSIGTGKLVLAHGSTVEMNGEDVKGITSSFVNTSTGTKLDQIIIQWNSDDKTFITETSSAIMPGFEAVKLVYTGMTYPAEEEFIVEADGDDSLVLSNFKTVKDSGDIHLLYSNGTNFTGLGYDSDNQLATTYSGNLTFIKGTHDYFVLSYKSGDVAESYIVRAASFDDGVDNTAGTSDDTVKIEYRVDGDWVVEDSAAKVNDIIEIGSASFTIMGVSDSTDTLIASASGNNNFHMIYSAEGLEVFLPWIKTEALNISNATEYSEANAITIGTPSGSGMLGYNRTIYYNSSVDSTEKSVNIVSYPATYTLLMKEENKDGAISSGNAFNFTIGLATSDSRVSVTAVNGATGGYEVGQSTKEYLYYVNGALATEILYNSGGDQDYATIKYHGGESYGNLYISESDATSTTGNPLGNVIYKDTEVTDTVKAKNLIVVGGSCINSVAADLLGGAYCGPEFTTATGISNGEALLKAYPNKYANGKVVVLVAGYEAADTQMGATYLINKNVDTSTVSSKVTTVTNAVDHALPA